MPQFKTPLEGAYYTAKTKGGVFPLARGTKIPPKGSKELYAQATTDEAAILAWSKQYPGCNWGFHPCTGNMTAIDLDNHAGKDGKTELKKWAASLGQTLPPTFTVKTPSGGLHLYFKGALPGSKDGFLHGVDVHSTGKYVVAPGSRTKEGVYEIIDDREPAVLPAWFVEQWSKAPQRIEPASKITAPASTADITEILSEIRSMAPLTPGERSNRAFNLIAEWRERGLCHYDRVVLAGIMADLGKVEFDPPDAEHAFTFESLIDVSKHVDQYAKGVAGSKSIEAQIAAFGGRRRYTAKELMKASLPPPAYLVDSLIPEGGMTFIVGAPKAGKSILALMLAKSLAEGSDFLGFHVPRTFRVAYLDMESDASLTQDRLKKLYGDGFSGLDNLCFDFKFRSLENGGFVDLRDLVKEFQPEVIIADTFQCFRKEWKDKTASLYTRESNELQMLITDVCVQYGVSLILTHHTRKPKLGAQLPDMDNINGSTAISAKASAVLMVQEKNSETSLLQVKGRSVKDRLFDLVKQNPIGWKKSDAPNTPFLLAETENQERIRKVLEDHPDGIRCADVKRILHDMSPKTVESTLSRWKTLGRVYFVNKKYSIPRVKQEESFNETTEKQ